MELTVGVICSCLTTFPGFFRYHLPLLKSIVSHFSSYLRSLHLPQSQMKSPSPASPRGLATEDVKVTLGSQVDGRGLFLNLASLFSSQNGTASRSQTMPKSLTTTKQSFATRRQYFEVAESDQARQSHISRDAGHMEAWFASGDAELGTIVDRGSSEDQDQSLRGQKHSSVATEPSKVAWSNLSRTGYWNVLSLFKGGHSSFSVLSTRR